MLRVLCAILAISVALVERCPVSTSALHLPRVLMQSRKLRVCAIVSEVFGPFTDFGSITAADPAAALGAFRSSGLPYPFPATYPSLRELIRSGTTSQLVFRMYMVPLVPRNSISEFGAFGGAPLALYCSNTTSVLSNSQVAWSVSGI